ncbi:hypothetical protein [Kitasatospora viridis]|uniref:Uncharacterized protein n=1 Tax=Kitasatospora viridis TaxID=281105 RepID=A0A561SA98_9ACTN|nr:hypothetical protein [Kitasatospora viridis]TWF71799.1 hypothetical protein FHX73_18170 [Kitasatospora viridis]
MTSRTEPVIIRDPQPYYIARTGLVNAEVAPFLVGTEILSTDDDGHATWRRVDGVISAPVSGPATAWHGRNHDLLTLHHGHEAVQHDLTDFTASSATADTRLLTAPRRRAQPEAPAVTDDMLIMTGAALQQATGPDLPQGGRKVWQQIADQRLIEALGTLSPRQLNVLLNAFVGGGTRKPFPDAGGGLDRTVIRTRGREFLHQALTHLLVLQGWSVAPLVVQAEEDGILYTDGTLTIFEQDWMPLGTTTETIDNSGRCTCLSVPGGRYFVVQGGGVSLHVACMHSPKS